MEAEEGLVSLELKSTDGCVTTRWVLGTESGSSVSVARL